MKQYRFIFILSLILITTEALSSVKVDKNSLLKQKIEQEIKKSRLRPKDIGIIISDVLSESRSSLFELNPDRLFIPASLSKIVTSSAVFHYLDPFDHFTTSLHADKPIKNGTLKGSLYLKGGGDPSFVSETLWKLVNQVTRSGLKTVEGSLIIDSSLFNTNSRKAKWIFERDQSFNALVSALSFNWNSVNVYIRPGDKKMDPTKVFLDPENSFLKLNNLSNTRGIKSKIKVRRIKSRNPLTGDVIQVTGSLPLGHSEKVVYKNISNPVLWTGYQTMEFLRRRGIVVEGDIYEGLTPASAKEIASVEGRSVFRLVQDMMKFSSNFIADSLIFHLSLLDKNKKRGVWKQGLKKVNQYLRDIGVKEYNFVSPSGLSRQNKFKPRDILRILIRDMDSAYSSEKISSYSLGGGDGTLTRRFKNLAHPAMIRGKTGWLNKVVGLGGYVMNIRGRKRAFVFMYNGSTKKQLRAQKLFDRLAKILSSAQ